MKTIIRYGKCSVVILILLISAVCGAQSLDSSRACQSMNDPNRPSQQWDDREAWYQSTREFNPLFPDVFYLVSTNIISEEGSLLARNTPEEKKILSREMKHMEVRVFTDSLNFFAPYYHQHTMEAMSLGKEEFLRLAEGIEDEVYAAFRYYMEHFNCGRPVVLVGFSQGAMLAKNLLKRMTPQEFSHIAAAYILGWGLNEEDVSDPQVRPAERADDVGVCISFNSVADTTAIWRDVFDEAAYSINPVNWKTDSTSAQFEYKGQMLSASLDTTVKVLVISGFKPTELAFTPFWPAGCYHFYEIQFYNSFLWHNALLRCRALQRQTLRNPE